MDARIIDLYNEYVHGDMPWLRFQQLVAEIAGGEEEAAAILPLIEPDYAWGQQVDPADRRLAVSRVEYAGASGAVSAYVARPRADGALPGILVIHENRGLNAHIEDVARRAALAGYVAVAPDGLSCVGGAPRDQEAARDRFQATDNAAITADLIRGIPYLKARDDCTGKVGALGFCYGGGVAFSCAMADPPCDAAVAFYGRAPDAEQVAQVRVPLMMNYAGNDARINATIPEFRDALDRNGVAYSLHMYPGTGHAFHNDTSRARYDEKAAKLAWQRTLHFLEYYLAD